MTKVRNHQKSQRGDGVLLVLMSILLLVWFLALAVDGARLFLTKLKSQAAADVAIASSVAMHSNGVSLDMRSTIANDMARFSLHQMRIDDNQIQVLSSSATGSASNVKVSLLSDFWFAQVLGFKRSLALDSEAAIKSPKLRVVYLFDVSNSMKLYDEKDGRTRLKKLQDAVFGFQALGMVRPNIDKLALVSFATRVVLNVPFSSGAGFDPNQIRTAVDNLKPAGSTNIGEGIEVARNLLMSLGSDPDAVDAIVIFSDGEPAFPRLRLNPSSVHALRRNNTSRAEYDYYLDNNHFNHIGNTDITATYPNPDKQIAGRGYSLYDPERLDASGALTNPSTAQGLNGTDCFDNAPDPVDGTPTVRPGWIGSATGLSPAPSSCVFKTQDWLDAGGQGWLDGLSSTRPSGVSNPYCSYWKYPTVNCGNMIHPVTKVSGNFCCLKFLDPLGPDGVPIIPNGGAPLPINETIQSDITRANSIVESDFARTRASKIKIFAVGIKSTNPTFMRRVVLDPDCFNDKPYKYVSVCNDKLFNTQPPGAFIYADSEVGTVKAFSDIISAMNSQWTK
jgi:hypothetical protein